MRALLDGLYKLSAALAAICLCVIAGLVLFQVFGRLIDGVLHVLGQTGIGLRVPSLNEIAGFLFVAATFLALAGTLRKADHIRVSMLIKAVGPISRRALETLVLAVGTLLAAYAAWHAVFLVVDSIQFNSVSYGVVRIPLALPQSALAFGLIVFAIALADDLVRILRTGEPSYLAHEEAKSELIQPPVTPEDAGRGHS